MYSYEHQAQYYETDQMGIIHHSNYIRWMESARLGWMQQLGVNYKEMEQKGIASPVLEVSCQYKSMVRFGDIVVVEPRIKRYNGIRLELSYRITDKETGEIRAVGSSMNCFLKDGAILSLKKEFSEYDQAFAANVSAV